MEPRSLLSAVVVCAVLAGCAVPMKPFGRGTKLDCDGTRSCTVAVAVTCSADPQRNCDISVDPELIILRTSTGNDKVTWELPQGSDFIFPPGSGIEIDPMAFDCKEDGKWKYACKSKRKEFGVFKYTVNLKGTRKADPLDPWVINN